MKFYEIKNTKNQKTAEAIAKNFTEACKSIGWKPYHCRCVWCASLENGYENNWKKGLTNQPQYDIIKVQKEKTKE